jgi:hypothetical protein
MLANVILNNFLMPFLEMNTSKAYKHMGPFSFWKKYEILRENLSTKSDLADQHFHNK